MHLTMNARGWSPRPCGGVVGFEAEGLPDLTSRPHAVISSQGNKEDGGAPSSQVGETVPEGSLTFSAPTRGLGTLERI